MAAPASRLAFMRLSVTRNLDLLFNVASLAVSTAGGAAIGFVFWWFAARSYPAEQLGVASAAISAMSLLGLAGDLGLGTFAMSAIHRIDRAAALISTCLLAAGLSSGVLGLAFLFGAAWVSPELAQFFEGPLRGSLFVAGVAITGLILVFDQILVGLMRSSLQLMRNLIASILKLSLLVGAVIWAGSEPLVIFLAWVFGALASVILVLDICVRQKCQVVATPDFRVLWGMGASILGHHALNLSTQVVGLLLPLIVTAMISPAANASFFAAWMIVQVWCLGPAALATVLFPLASKERGRLAHLMRLTLILSVAIGVMGEIFLVTAGRAVLTLFNPDFLAEGYGALIVLGAGIIPLAAKYHFVALRRIEDRTAGTSVLLSVAAIFEIACAVFGAQVGGVFGLSLGWLLANITQMLLMCPVLVRAMRD